MSNETLIKLRAYLVLLVAFLIYPIILAIFLSKYLYDSFLPKKVSPNIAGEVAVITGAAGGLGKCIAEELASKGCNVAICDVNFELAKLTAEEIANKYGVKAKAYKVDVTKHEEIEELNKKLTDDIGVATILVNNAGIILHADQLNPSVKEIDDMVNVNYKSHFLTNRVFLKNMREAKKGYIMAIGSVSGLFLWPFSEPYCSCKTAVRTLMRNLRTELNIEKVNYIHLTSVFPLFLQTNAATINLAIDNGFTDRYPLLKGEDVAKSAVRGMLRGEVEIALPGFVMLLYRLISLLPAKSQDLLMGYLFADTRPKPKLN